MSEPLWTSKPIVQPVPDQFEYTATIEGLVVKVMDHRGWVRWEIDGFYQDIRVFAHHGGHDRERTVEDAKVEAVDTARRLYAAGWRGEKSYPVSCCDRTLPTAEAAARHEADHKADQAVIHFAPHSLTVACDADPEPIWEEARWTEDPAAVTCRACRLWVVANANLTPEQIDAVAYTYVRPGPEQADIEHAADIVAREQVRRATNASEESEA